MKELDCEILAAGSAREALRLLLQPQDIALLLLDFHMPGMSGLEMARTLRQHERFQHVPIVFITATSEAVQEIEQGYAVGALNFLFVPIPAELLRTRVQAYLNQFSHQRQVLRQVREIEQLNVALLSSQQTLRGFNATLEQRVQEQTAALRESESLCRSLLEIPGVDVFRKDREGRFVFVNDQLCQRLGRSREALLGQTDFEVSPRALAEKYRRDDQQIMATGQPLCDIEQHGTLAEAAPAWGQVVKTPVRDAAGRIVGVQGISWDVTAQRRAEEKMRDQAAVLDQVPSAISVRDLEGRFQYWNQGAARLFGWTADEALGRTSQELSLGSGPAPLAEDWRIVREQGEWRGELALRTKAGGRCVVQAHHRLVRQAAEGAPHAVVSIATDITEHKKLEAQFLRAQRLENLGQLAGGIAHDLNNILAPILMSVPLLREKITDGAAGTAALLAAIETSAQRGAGVVQQILTFARGQAGEKAVLQPRHLLKEMGRIIQETFPKCIQFESDAPAGLWPVIADATQLHQISLNLCVNARDAMPKGGTLRLTAENTQFNETTAATTPGASPGDYVLLRVRDTGTSIPADILDRIFDPFFTTKEVGKGTGLGLSTVLGLIKGHGGMVEVDSQPGRGTEFRVYLPAAPHTLPVDILAAALPCGQGELILVVDDEALVRQAVQSSLQRYGYGVLLAADGNEALALYARHPEIQLVLTDLMMPAMNGVVLLRSLRRINPGVRAIVATGMTDEIQGQSVRASGAQMILLKPFSIGALLAALREVLAPPAAEAERRKP